MRHALKSTAHGLTEEQARLTPTPSALSIGGLIKHVARVEHHWFVGSVAQQPERFAPNPEDWGGEFRLLEGESLASALAIYDEVAKETEEIVAGISDLGRAVPVPPGVPWFPKNVKNWSVRWVLLHMIQETARHGGHADIIREAIDGGTYYPLLAAYEGWTGDFMVWASQDVPLS
jgi:hypothetical protein